LNPTEQAVMTRVAALIEARFPDAAGRVTPEMTADEVKDWNSLSHTLLLMDVEKSFDLEIPIEEGLDLDSVGALVRLIARITVSS
jgi:acyl carrier protein